ncbi:MAG: alpha/beta family hydrolase [Candidatus Latescibacterota bacterium]
MVIDIKEITFVATKEKGEVSALLSKPRGAKALLVLGHGAGTNMRHTFMAALSDALNAVGVATFRFNYPYSETGGGMDGEKVRLATVRAAVEKAKTLAKGLPVFAGGHSMSGRMFSMAVAQEAIEGMKGIVFFAFPLYASKPNTERAEHLKAVNVPMLFLSGQRDKMADLKLLAPVVKKLKDATLHEVDTADHGFKVLKRRATEEPVIDELARVAGEWMLANV